MHKLRLQINNLLENIPRKNCHQSEPQNIIQKFITMYRVNSIPKEIKPFVIK